MVREGLIGDAFLVVVGGVGVDVLFILVVDCGGNRGRTRELGLRV
jgi:hypothetical protein